MVDNNLVRFGGIYFCKLFVYGFTMSLDTGVRKEEVDTALMARRPETTECMVAISHTVLLCWRLFIDKMCKRW